ncbi:MAG TPA: hypothetical protein VGQ99_14645 [Tepidisphaeraceae bacterium]|jgi:hypothetical protein|nr:hypothetical protein [Tepidisphaeraceae bacterium]
MLLQTNSYVVPNDKREEHERLIRRIRQAMLRLGCDIEVYEQVSGNWGPLKGGAGRFIQIMRFRDRQHHHEIQEVEKNDSGIQQLITEFMDLIDLPEQQGQGLFAMGHYSRITAAPVYDMEQAPMPAVAEQPVGQPPQAQPGDVGLIRDLEPEHDEAGGNSKPAEHEESEF